LPRPCILHPFPHPRFDARHPRWEPYALCGPRTDLCGGCGATRIPTATQRWKRWWVSTIFLSHLGFVHTDALGWQGDSAWWLRQCWALRRAGGRRS
jgi:hypothetical protein